MKKTAFDGRVLNGLVTKIVKATEKAEKEIDRVNKKYNRLVFNGLRKIARTAIADFYHSYSPKIYDRHGDLYNTFEIKATDEQWDILVGPEFMKYTHHDGGDDGPVSNDYIYELTMKKGFHGGAPHNGSYYWRTPYPEYTDWWDTPAEQYKKNVEQDILETAGEFIEYMNENANKEFDSKMRPFIEDIKDSLSRL